jgi:hypothetical protein
MSINFLKFPVVVNNSFIFTVKNKKDKLNDPK